MTLLFAYLVLGYLIQRFSFVKTQGPFYLNKFVLYVSLPAIIFLKTRDIPISTEALIPIFMPVLNFALSFFTFYFLGKKYNWSRGKTGATILLAGLGNTSFLGFPLIRHFYGEDYITYGLMVDQGGSFITVSTVGLIVASVFSGNRINFKTITKKVLFFPTTIAFVLALICIRWDYPQVVESTCSYLGDLLGPAALIAIGLQLSFTQIKSYKKEIVSILSFKMFGFALLCLLIALIFFDVQSPLIQITLFEAMMPPMITAGIIAQEYGLEKEMAPNIVGSGIIAVFALAPLWFWLLKTI